MEIQAVQGLAREMRAIVNNFDELLITLTGKSEISLFISIDAALQHFGIWGKLNSVQQIFYAHFSLSRELNFQ